QEQLLGETDLDWAYSEIFQCYTREEIERYYPYAGEVSFRCGTLANFAETHDNPRLAEKGELYAANRFAVSALLSSGGAFGFANGAEFFARERIDVHGNGALNYGAAPNLNAAIARYNRLLADHPAFDLPAQVRLIQRGGGNVIAAKRTAENGATLLVLINLNCREAETVCWPENETPGSGFDLLAERACDSTLNAGLRSCRLAPGEARCVTFDDYRIPAALPPEPPRREQRRFCELALRLAAIGNVGTEVDIETLRADPAKFVADLTGIFPAPVTRWIVPIDARREVMLPPHDTLLVESAAPYRFAVSDGKTRLVTAVSLPRRGGGFFTLLPPFPETLHDNRILDLAVTVFPPEESTARHLNGNLRLLPMAGKADFSRIIPAPGLSAFGSNSTGGYMLVAAAWSKIFSKYNALLAANLNPDHPVDRTVIFNRCRAWLVVNDFSAELNREVTTGFCSHPDNTARWVFQVPTGQGGRATIRLDLSFAPEGNAVHLTFSRPIAEDTPGELDAVTPAKLILRPDLEWRTNHQLTKAYSGPEKLFPSAIRAGNDGFVFAPYGTPASFRVSRGVFHRQDEWIYMAELPFEHYYGLENRTDLYSPGYFEITLRGGDEVTLAADLETTPGPRRFPKFSTAVLRRPEEFMDSSLRHYVVKRDGKRTVIAGYPWFLDWGRDTLIALRGLLKCGFRQECVEIIRQFAGFEDRGTIPNMIHGSDTGNRDTSDAPLYLIVAVRDCIAETGDTGILDLPCGTRKLREVLGSIVDHYLAGTPNGIAADPASLLVYSPAHFSWMDTAHPAGTPRAGYPIEIQALWYAALKFLGRKREAERVKRSIAELYFPPGLGFCSDCLHADARVPAAQAIPDDHLRSNQLFAVTLGAIDDPARRGAIIDACGELLVPGAIRTLADREVKFRLPIELNGRLLNDPAHPYQGRYAGPEDTSRKVAYHNGTAWCWPFPSYCEALFLAGGEAVRQRALALLESMAGHFNSGVPFQPPEVVDGDAPHHPGGCPAQAWSLSEFFRVYKMLTAKQNR
ncbi:MAG: glycogen debranching enzyme N-terminal domain-containing protein, partial [Lentisphaeria bacterium]|nr:glycogen debranching enzyme N-terminal domain-containing protein [Lentisphaeria bacterium]